MWYAKLILIVCVLCYLNQMALAAPLSFTANTIAGKELIQPLQLTCSIETSNEFTPLFMYILKGSSNILAYIYEPFNKEINSQKDNCYVEAKLSNTSLTYIKMTWKHPTESDTGLYKCYTSARDTFKQSTLNITIEKPTFVELMSFSRLQANLVEDQSALLLEFGKQFKDLEEIVKNVSSEITAVKAGLSSLKAGSVSGAQVQEGFFICGNSKNYTFVDNVTPNNTTICLPYRQQVTYIPFKTPYLKTPTILLEMRRLDLGFGVRYYFHHINASASGFNLVCGTWCDTQVYMMRINWQSIG